MRFAKVIQRIKKVDSKNAKSVADIFEFNRDKFSATLEEIESKSIDKIICSILSTHYVGLPCDDSLGITLNRIRDTYPALKEKILENYQVYNEKLTHLQRNDISKKNILKTYLKMHKAYNSCLKGLEKVHKLDRADKQKTKYNINEIG